LTARRHHYIPRCYLKGFAKDKERPQLFVVDSKECTSFTTLISNIAAERDFHRLDAPGQPQDALENKIAEFEGDLAPTLERVIADRSIVNIDDRSNLFTFMALLCIKNPGMRETIGAAAGKMAQLTLEMMAATPEEWRARMERAKNEGTMDQDADADALRKMILDRKFKFTLTTPAHLDIEFGSLETLHPYFLGRNWVLCKADAGTTGFITSDRPVCVAWQDPKNHAPAGLRLKGTQVAFPISNDLAMIGPFELDAGEMDADEDFVSKVNGNIILLSNHQVYARDDNFVYRLKHNPTMMHGKDLLNDPVTTGEEVGAS